MKMISKSHVFGIALLSAALLCILPSPVQAQAGTETLTLIDSSCIAAAPCTLELYRAAILSGTTSCPLPGTSAYTALMGPQVLSLGVVNTAWTYADSTVLSGTTYCYYATVTFVSGGTASRPSAFFEVAVPALVPATAPVITGAYTPLNQQVSIPATARANATSPATPLPPATAPKISGTYQSSVQPASAPATGSGK